MRRAERDDEFAEFVSAHRGALVSMGRLLTAGDQAWAEDLVQTTLTKLYVSWSRVRRAGNPVGYARTTLTHAFVDETRRAYRRREIAAGGAGDDAFITEGGSRTARASDSAPDVELRRDVLAALAGLAPRQRAVVVLRHWLDLDVAETARLLDCTEGTVKSQNAKALAHLRAALGEHKFPAHPVPEEIR
ncbi:SigE family RNA polymerase sigma factor [Nocardioides sp. 1609]|uniref:SigE family RNA polymerase sigma factor n=1 Tax=Nocardioides sp. 1609 TaxID=2508327 RepID=UPI00106F4209|nr:SigE family RNA polymerase sigma factor [Nocardioides sp. 1609]